MVATVHDPGGEARDRELARLEGSVADAEARDGTEVLVLVVLRGFTAQHRHEVLRELLALAHGVLRVRHAEPADTAAREVGHRGDVARRPRGVDDAVVVDHAQVCLRTQAAALVDRQVGAAQNRVGHDAGRPDDEIRLEGLARRELDAAVHGARELRLEVHDRGTLGEVLENPVARLEGHLGHDAAHRLDEVEVRVVDRQLRVLSQECAREAAQLGEGLDAREAAPHDDDGEQSIALRAGRQQSGAVEVVDEAVAHRDGLLDRLHADGLIGHAGNGERARDGAGGHDDVVVVELEWLPHLGLDRGRLARVVHTRHLRRDDTSALEVATVRDDRVTRLEGARRDLRQERLIGHVGQRVDENDLGFTLAQPLLELQSGVETGVASTDDENSGHEKNTP